MTEREQELFDALKVEDILEVYSGKPGRCACGCSGKYSVASAHHALADQRRGYPLENVNDRMVKKVFNLMRIHADEVMAFGEGFSLSLRENYSGGREYNMYLVNHVYMTTNIHRVS